MDYYLVYGIYPEYSILVQTIRILQGKKKELLQKKQETCREDIEHAFGGMQSKFSIIAGSSRYWKKDSLHDIITTCMIIEDEMILMHRQGV